MEIEVTEDLKIVSDRRQWIVKERMILKSKETGEPREVWTNRWYCTSLVSALRGLPDHLARSKKYDDVRATLQDGGQKVMEAINDIQATMANALFRCGLDVIQSAASAFGSTVVPMKQERNS